MSCETCKNDGGWCPKCGGAKHPQTCGTCGDVLNTTTCDGCARRDYEGMNSFRDKFVKADIERRELQLQNQAQQIVIDGLKGDVEKLQKVIDGMKADAQEAYQVSIEEEREKQELQKQLADKEQQRLGAHKAWLDLNKEEQKTASENCELRERLANVKWETQDEMFAYWKAGFAKHGFILHSGLTPEQNAQEWLTNANARLQQEITSTNRLINEMRPVFDAAVALGDLTHMVDDYDDPKDEWARLDKAIKASTSQKRNRVCLDCGKELKHDNLCLECCRKRWPDSPNCPLPHE